jgi:hypothetical protein
MGAYVDDRMLKSRIAHARHGHQEFSNKSRLRVSHVQSMNRKVQNNKCCPSDFSSTRLTVPNCAADPPARALTKRGLLNKK